MRKKYVITGASGLLGQAMIPYLANQGHEVYALCHKHSLSYASPLVHEIKCDLREKAAVADILDEIAPDILIHAAGLTSVDQCENDPELAFFLNTEIPTRLAKWCAHYNTRYVFISSDHVTGGVKPLFNEQDEIAPVNVYAQSKAQAEDLVLSACPAALAIRTNFFGRGPAWRTSLTDWLWDKALASEVIPAFTDSYFSPISALLLAQNINALASGSEVGLFHVGGSERLSKYEFALAFVDFFKFDRALVRPSLTADAQLSAPRPADMSMSVKKVEAALGWAMPTVVQSFESIQEDYRAN